MQTGDDSSLQDLLSSLADEVRYLSIHARTYRSPSTDSVRCLIEALFLLTLGQDFFVGTRVDGRLSLDDVYAPLTQRSDQDAGLQLQVAERTRLQRHHEQRGTARAQKHGQRGRVRVQRGTHAGRLASCRKAACSRETSQGRRETRR